MTDKDTLDRLNAREDGALERTYAKYRILYARRIIKKFGCSEEDAIEIYQRGFLGFLENIANGKALWGDVGALLYKICENKCLEFFRNKKRWLTALGNYLDFTPKQDNPWETNDEEVILEKLQKAMEQLGENCKKALHLYYFENLPDKEIIGRMGFESLGYVRIQRWRCIQQLKEMLFQ